MPVFVHSRFVLKVVWMPAAHENQVLVTVEIQLHVSLRLVCRNRCSGAKNHRSVLFPTKSTA